ncbi:unnamed protein product [Fusarium equiseti]|uniref:Uncharacterized protein n=1 Tax=Fusarium equiseti TaxID=61235 RepID=A0A8J2ILR5_FUSEQ|nr:unnamed protein product [Fusarium equiseti]
MAEQSFDPQLQSTFLTRLPRELHDKVYLELWRSCGLRQHIIWHHNEDDVTKAHFCRWQCTTPFEVEDGLQAAINNTRIELGASLGGSFSNKTHALQLFSTWKNHFACGERIGEVYGDDAGPGVTMCSSFTTCWSQTSEGSATWSPYLAMLLTCSILSSECTQSIYESTTFIFTDIAALNMFVGFCKIPDRWIEDCVQAIPPPAFRTHGRHVELSLEPVFPILLPCSSPIISPLSEERHSSSDFHALRLDLLQNLTTLNVWIAARSTVLMLDEDADNIDQSPYNITQLGIDSIKEALAPLDQVKNITLSMPLASVSDPEDGYIVDTAHLRIWRRGSGDRFHPALLPVFDVGRFSSNVHSTEDRKVKLAYNPGSVTHVHYATGCDVSTVSSDRGLISRLVESIWSKGKRLKRNRKH